MKTVWVREDANIESEPMPHGPELQYHSMPHSVGSNQHKSSASIVTFISCTLSATNPKGKVPQQPGTPMLLWQLYQKQPISACYAGSVHVLNTRKGEKQSMESVPRQPGDALQA